MYVHNLLVPMKPCNKGDLLVSRRFQALDTSLFCLSPNVERQNVEIQNIDIIM
jgi:hypothetical protein